MGTTEWLLLHLLLLSIIHQYKTLRWIKSQGTSAFYYLNESRFSLFLLNFNCIISEVINFNMNIFIYPHRNLNWYEWKLLSIVMYAYSLEISEKNEITGVVVIWDLVCLWVGFKVFIYVVAPERLQRCSAETWWVPAVVSTASLAEAVGSSSMAMMTYCDSIVVWMMMMMLLLWDSVWQVILLLRVHATMSQ